MMRIIVLQAARGVSMSSGYGSAAPIRPPDSGGTRVDRWEGLSFIGHSAYRGMQVSDVVCIMTSYPSLSL